MNEKDELGGSRLDAGAVVKRPVMVRASIDGHREVWGYCFGNFHKWRQEENGEWRCTDCDSGPLKVAW